MSLTLDIRLPLLKAAVIQTVAFSLMIPVILMFGPILAGKLSDVLNIVSFAKSLVLGFQISLLLSLPSLLESLLKFPIKDSFSQYYNDAILVILASPIFFLISLTISGLNIYGHADTPIEAIFDALFMTVLFIALNLVLRLPWLKDKGSTS